MDFPISRRGFAVRGAGALLALVGGGLPRSARAMQQGRVETARGGPGWLPDQAFLNDLPRLLELAAVPGLAMSSVEGSRVWTGGFGLARVETGAEVSERTVFEGASLGKPIFAYAVLRLVDAGRLDLDRPLYKYLPIPEADNARMRRVTPRHVLTHTTGLANWRTKPGPLVPSTDPGKEFSYSGEGFFYLQRVVEQITGQGIGRYMREQVLQPLGMPDSSFVWSPQYEGAMATGYDEREDRLDVYADIGRSLEPLAASWDKPMLDWRYADVERATAQTFGRLPTLPVYMAPNVAGSLLTTAADYARFLGRTLAEPGPGGLDLSAALRREMLSSKVRLNSALSWGLGWGLQQDDGEFFWHWGANGSFRNFVIGDIRNRRGVVVLTNSANGPKIYQRVIASLTGRDHPAFLWFQI
jgi:CubicO group peptidase (beta-lactamase class C family)